MWNWLKRALRREPEELDSALERAWVLIPALGRALIEIEEQRGKLTKDEVAFVTEVVDTYVAICKEFADGVPEWQDTAHYDNPELVRRGLNRNVVVAQETVAKDMHVVARKPEEESE